MSTSVQSRSEANPFLIFSLLALALLLSAVTIIAGKLAVFGLVGGLFFVVFATFPVLGLYATTALLLLSGSTGVIGFVNSDATIAVTLAKLCGAAALGAWLLNLLVRKTRFELNWPIILICSFVGWAMVSTLLSRHLTTQWPEWIRLVTLLGYLLLAVNTLYNPRNLHYFIVLILLCGLAMSFAAVAQYFLPGHQLAGAGAWSSLGAVDAAFIDQESLQGDAAIRVSGRAGHSNWLAMIILLILPLNAYWYTLAQTRKMKGFIFLMVGIEIMVLILTYTRTGLVIGIVIGALMLLKNFLRMTPQRLFGFLFAVVLVYALVPHAYKERVLSPSQYTTSTSVQSRIQLQEAALHFFEQHPITGLGMGGFGDEFVHENNDTAKTFRYMVKNGLWLPVFIGTHNMYLEIAASTGIIGLALFVAFFVLMLRKLYLVEEYYREQNDLQGAALASSLFVSLVGFAFCAVFLHALTQKIWWMVVAPAIVLPLYHLSFKDFVLLNGRRAADLLRK